MSHNDFISAYFYSNFAFAGFLLIDFRRRYSFRIQAKSFDNRRITTLESKDKTSIISDSTSALTQSFVVSKELSVPDEAEIGLYYVSRRSITPSSVRCCTANSPLPLFTKFRVADLSATKRRICAPFHYDVALIRNFSLSPSTFLRFSSLNREYLRQVVARIHLRICLSLCTLRNCVGLKKKKKKRM